MALIDCLAADAEYWDFIGKGKTGQLDKTRSFGTPHESSDTGLQRRNDSPLQIGAEMGIHELVEKVLEVYPQSVNIFDVQGKNIYQVAIPLENKKTSDAGFQRWNFSSPLITGAKMGLHEFVDKIMEVYPQSVNILDFQDKNIMQVVIQLGSKKIFDLVASKLTGRNPLLPSRLLYARDDSNNTILHYAAEVTVDVNLADALQMQKDLQWFEEVENLMPRDLQYSRNTKEMTAQELFSEKHKEMAKKGEERLILLGQTCSSIVAAFVFASSFSIPSSNDSNGGNDIKHKAAFFVFKNAFVIGLSCAATALVLFLSLITSSYREREFRRSLPTKFFFATLSFILALISLLVAFACNIYLQIYSEKSIGAKGLIPFVCELTAFPAFTFFVLFYRGCSFGIISLIRHVWR